MKSILSKLRLIASECGYIAKDKENSFQRYKYASEEAIKKALHPLFDKHGVVFQVQVQNPTVMPCGEKGELLTTIDIHYAFHDVDTGEKLEGVFLGTGTDKGDKGVYKAITGGIKYILTSTFLIPTGTDPEDEKNEPEAKAKDGNPVAYVKHTRAALPPKTVGYSVPISVPIMDVKPPSEQVAVPYRPAGAKVYGTAKPYELAETKPKEEMPADWLKEDKSVTIEEAVRMMSDKVPPDEEFAKYRRMSEWNPAAKPKILDKMRELGKWTEEELAKL